MHFNEFIEAEAQMANVVQRGGPRIDVPQGDISPKPQPAETPQPKYKTTTRTDYMFYGLIAVGAIAAVYVLTRKPKS